MAALEVTPELTLVGIDNSDIRGIDTELSSFGVVCKGVMRRSRRLVVTLLHIDILARESHDGERTGRECVRTVCYSIRTRDRVSLR